MPRASVNGVELEYDSFGEPASTPLLLLMGLSYQMIEWDDAVCQTIADRGFWVTRFDNRDVGLSSKLDQLGIPDLLGAMAGTAAPPYTLDDMAGDAVGLLDVLGISAAHVVGVSMGGMIAQLIAINHPERVLSLTSMMSTVGGPNVVQAQPDVIAALLVPPGPTHQERVEHSLAVRRLINGAGVPFDEERARRKAERAVDRSFHPDGGLRQIVAILAAPDRAPALSRLTIPTLVVHGEEDPLVPPDNGRQTAAALPNARLIMIADMGHYLPERVWPDVVDAIVALAGSAARS
ncbi:MAG TPA: alpha/beta hydrolase [Candidatus Dormibacteraeota bacterium]|jgi:pimeloyl-ACP methyl ester carboxylesterase|nr:alpha/beta hydrolase [Candidatus Dormibacteraeota bacterium]